MLPEKIRTAKIQKKILQPEGIELWQAPIIAKGILNTITNWLDGKSEIILDDLDIAIIRETCKHIRNGSPGIGWPFTKIKLRKQHNSLDKTLKANARNQIKIGT